MLSKLRQWLICGVVLALPGLAPAASNVYDISITRVIDGDTIVFAAPWLPPPLKPELALRISGIDTPESGFRAKCQSERERAASASAFVATTIAASREHKLVLLDWDKYGGRVLGDLLLDGVSLKQTMIQYGHAVQYDGGTKTSWCLIK